MFPTGRGRLGSPSYRRSLVERLVPARMPGRSCFATISGPLVNGAHGTVHLCCLPQSPVIGTCEQPAHTVLERYRATLATFHREVERRQRAGQLSHACSVCEDMSQWDTRVRPSTAPLEAAGHGAVHHLERLDRAPLGRPEPLLQIRQMRRPPGP